jgi:hypothetical protein
MNQPGQSSATIGDLIPEVKSWLQNRSDVTEDPSQQPNPAMRPSAWIRDSLREITASQQFEELRTTGPLKNIGPGLGYNGSNYQYLISYFLDSGADYTMMEDPVIFLTPTQAMSVGLVGTSVSSSNSTVGYPMDYVTPKAIQSILFISGGIPFKYTRYGNQFWFGTQPGTNYQVNVPYQIRHPFIDTELVASPVYVPADWLDIIAIAAAERGATKLRWNEQSSFLHQMLWGDPATQMKDGVLGMPGLVTARKLQMSRDKRLSTVQFMPIVSRY